MANRRNGTIYLGQTSELMGRVWEHQNDVRPCFTSKYGCKRLVWYEWFETREDAFRRERQMKKWLRRWKIAAIEQLNPRWDDLSRTMTDEKICEAQRMGVPFARAETFSDGSLRAQG